MPKYMTFKIRPKRKKLSYWCNRLIKIGLVGRDFVLDFGF